MYEITVEASFSAAHALMISGTREPNHGHNWHVTVTIAGPTLDPDGLLCDFHTVRDQLLEVIEPMNNADLNLHPAFKRQNASAELVAKHIADELHDRIDGSLAPYGAKLVAVRVTEATGCATTYRP
jgi:6-pyruvoyltetrahydropterin/6-carboxytetrahydropterin synthase